MTIKWQDAALLLAAAFLLGLLLAHGGQTSSNDTVHEKEIVRARIDTAHSLVDVPLHPLLAKGKSNHVKTIILHDTIYREACLDTVIRNDTSATAPDTLSVCYARNNFFVQMGFAERKKYVAVPYLAHDTFYSREDTVRIENNPHAWYDDILVVIISLAAGIIVGKL